MPIPSQVSVERALARSERYEGEIEAARLPRLAELQPQRVSAVLDVGRVRGGFGQVSGQIEAGLRLECRTCGTPYDWVAKVAVELALARDEAEEARLMERAEPLLVTDDVLPLVQLVEDELLLGLPMMPRCAACENAGPAAPEASAESPTRRPLAALKALDLKGGGAARGK